MRLFKLRQMLLPAPIPYRRIFRMTLKQWLIYHQKKIVFDQCRWMGARALKNPFDSWIYQEIIYEVKPDVIIEIGSNEGGSTLFLAHILDLIGNGIVISIDIDRSKFSVKHDRIRVITGDSSAPETVRAVKELCHDRRTLIIHDGNHESDHVLKDLRAYEGLVTIGSYLIIEDGIVDFFVLGDGMGQRFHGPFVATEIFLKENNNFVVDKSRERYLLTYNPKGFLKRIR